jgi:hypothetical protein
MFDEDRITVRLFFERDEITLNGFRQREKICAHNRNSRGICTFQRKYAKKIAPKNSTIILLGFWAN